MKLKQFLNEKDIASSDEIFTKDELKLKKMGISGAQALGNGKFKIQDDDYIDDGTYTMEELIATNFGFIEVKTLKDGSYEVWGDFEGDPEYLYVKIKILHGHFDCSGQKLKKLSYCPEIVDRYFDCSYNNLGSLKGCPREIGGGLFCFNNELSSLKGCPSEIGGDFDCSENSITSLKYAPKKNDGGYNISHNPIKSLEGCPEKINGTFNCSYCYLTSFKGGPKYIEWNCVIGDNYVDLDRYPLGKDSNDDLELRDICHIEGDVELED